MKNAVGIGACLLVVGFGLGRLVDGRMVDGRMVDGRMVDGRMVDGQLEGRGAVRAAANPEVTAARVAMDRLVAHAIADHAWHDADREQFRALKGQLPADAIVDSIRPLVVAVDDQRVTVDVQGPMF